MGDRGGLFLVGFVVGALTGAAAALLLTPYSGEEMRDQIKEKGIQLKDEAGQRAAEVRTQATQMAEDARIQAQQLQDRGRIVLSDNVKKAQQAVQAAQAKLEKPEAGPSETAPV